MSQTNLIAVVVLALVLVFQIVSSSSSSISISSSSVGSSSRISSRSRSESSTSRSRRPSSSWMPDDYRDVDPTPRPWVPVRPGPIVFIHRTPPPKTSVANPPAPSPESESETSDCRRTRKAAPRT